MKKTLLIALVSVIALSCIFAFPVFADGEASYAEVAPGGSVSSIEDVATAFGGEENVTARAEGEEIRIYFEKSIKLLSPVVIKSGTYRIFGRDCSLFRGFENGSLIVLDGSDGNGPKLIIEEKSLTDWETGKTAIFTFDGNKSDFPTAKGALITVKGNGRLTLDGKVLFKNALSTELGGAISVEAVQNGDGYFSPSVSLNYCKITECYSLVGGGGIALVGGKNGEGEVILTDVIMEKNEAVSTGKSAKGGALYVSGGTVKLSGSFQLANNKADIGGTAYIAGYAELEGGSVRDSAATVSGGAFYCGVDTERGTSGTIAMNNTYVSYGISDGNGGAITNEGTLLIGGSTYLTDCKAKGDGGAVYNLGSFGFSSGDIITNKADGKAGAIYNGLSGILIVSGGRISSNDASLCGGIYSEGVFEFKGGSIGKSLGSAPQNLVSGIMRIGDSATFTDTEVIGILLKDGTENTVISVTGKLTSRVKQTVAFYKTVTDKNGADTVKLANGGGMRVFASENAEALLSAVKGFKVQGEGLKNYKISSDGALAFKLPLMPLWGWILTVIALIGATVGVIFAVKYFKNKNVNAPKDAYAQDGDSGEEVDASVSDENDPSEEKSDEGAEKSNE